MHSETPLPESVDLPEPALEQVFMHPGHLIRRVHQIFLSVFEDEFALSDISPPQYMILTAVHDVGEMDMSAISAAAAVDKASCSRFVARLVERGLLAMSADAADQRRKLVRMTQKGEKALPRLHLHSKHLKARLFENLSDDQAAAFLQALHHFADVNNALSRAPHRPPQAASPKIASKEALDD